MLLTPAEIERLRDLIQLGGLTTVEEDNTLLSLNLVDFQGPRTFPLAAVRDRYYNRQGGVKGHWWRDSEQPFASWMRADADTVVTRLLVDMLKRFARRGVL